MRHFRIRYTIDKMPTASDLEREFGLVYAVSDHQTGEYRAKGLTWDSAHRLIDRLTGVDTFIEHDEFDAEPRLADHTRAMARMGAFGR